MKRVLLIACTLLSAATAVSQAISQKRQAVSYNNLLINGGDTIKNASISMIINIIQGSLSGPVIYAEQHTIKTDTAGRFHLEIGKGITSIGQFDSIIWSDGTYYLKTEAQLPGRKNYKITHHTLIRIPPELTNDYEQGTVSSTDHPDWGEWHFRNTRNKRPRLVTVDLTTSYANLAYPANTYPIYRHYEWSDPDRSGIGNAFGISFSENTSNDFKEHTNRLGEVRLYAIPFQELNISSTNSEISVSISKPIPVSNLGENYAVKGPWKFIFYIEW